MKSGINLFDSTFNLLLNKKIYLLNLMEFHCLKNFTLISKLEKRKLKQPGNSKSWGISIS
jgi:hypothetical protein